MPKNKLTFSENKIISLQTANTSKGNQPKWYDKHSDCYIKAQFYYQEKYWRDDLVEVIASAIGDQLDLTDKKVSVLHQYPCDIALSGQILDLPLRECLKQMECKPFHHDNLKVIDYIKTRYHLENYLPVKFDFRGCVFPSAKATSYLLNRCRHLGIAAEGVAY